MADCRAQTSVAMIPSLVAVLVVVLVAAAGAQQRHYAVVAPDTVRPNTNYLASVAVDGTEGELQVGSCWRMMRAGTPRHIKICDSFDRYLRSSSRSLSLFLKIRLLDIKIYDLPPR